MENFNRRNFINKSILTIGAMTTESPLKFLVTILTPLKEIKIKSVDSNFEREPLMEFWI